MRTCLVCEDHSLTKPPSPLIASVPSFSSNPHWPAPSPWSNVEAHPLSATISTSEPPDTVTIFVGDEAKELIPAVPTKKLRRHSKSADQTLTQPSRPAEMLPVMHVTPPACASVTWVRFTSAVPAHTSNDPEGVPARIVSSTAPPAVYAAKVSDCVLRCATFLPETSQNKISAASTSPTPPIHSEAGPPQQAKPTLVSGIGDAAAETPSSHLPDMDAHVATVNKFWRPTPTPTSVEPSSEKTRCVTDFRVEGNEPQWAPVSVSKTCTVDSEPTSATAP